MNKPMMFLLAGMTALSCVGESTTNISVQAVNVTKKIGSSSPTGGSDHKFVTVEVKIENHESNPIPTTIALFWIVTDAGLATQSSPFSAMLPGFCDQSMLLEPGASVVCPVAFEIDLDAMPVKVRFQLPSTDTVVDEINLEPCEWCGNECYDLVSGTERCGDCDTTIIDGQTCVDGNLVCQDSGATACPGECADLKTSVNNCGTCGNKLGTGLVCVDGAPSCADQIKTRCGNVCVDLQTDRKNCGQCGNAISPSALCQNGKAVCPTGQTLCSDGCHDLDTDENNCGSCGTVVKSPRECVDGKPTCPDGQFSCGTICVESLSDNENCGKCGVRCRGNEECFHGLYCAVTVSNANYLNTCKARCESTGRTCVGGFLWVDNLPTCQCDAEFDCDTAPIKTEDCDWCKAVLSSECACNDD